jgi:subtilisin family serine protease
MKKMLGIAITLVLLVTFSVPVLANVIPDEGASSDTPEFSSPEWTEPELLPQEILDAFEGGMSIEEFLSRNQGPIPNALLDYVDQPVTVIVQLEKPSLIEYVTEAGLSRGDNTLAQEDYVAQLKSDQAAVLSEITAGRASDVHQIGESLTMALNGFMLNVPANMINEIRAISGVKAVSQAPEYQINLGDSIPLIGADLVWGELDYTGEGVEIAVIDTGIDYTHAMLGGSGIAADYTANDPDIIEPGSFPNAKVVGGYDFAGTDYMAGEIPVPDDDPLDENGHGTHVASTAAGNDGDANYGVAPDASLYALKVFGATGGTNLAVLAIEWAMDPHDLGNLSDPVDVINMSLGADWGPADEFDPEYQAVENATSIGVVVVASAGNSGDSSYIVGSPSTVDSAISVAASTTASNLNPYITYDTDHYIPYTTSDNPFTATITAELVDVSVAVDPSGLLCSIPADYAGQLTGKIALISRGSCSFSDKINNAEALGAVAAIIYNNTAGAIGMITDDSTLPAGSILQIDGWTLLDLAPIEISIGPDTNERAFVDYLGDFSSRGPRGFDSKLKPEVTAPGVAISAAEIGSGTGLISYNGTSMAAPHVAGLAALMVEAHPELDPAMIKAMMMNTAVDLVGYAEGVVPLQGAGRIDAVNAVTSPYAFYSDPELISLSWGLIELTADYSDVKTITAVNNSDSEENFDVSVVFTSVSDGATLTPALTTIAVPAHGQLVVDFTLELDAELIAQSFGDMEEYYGYVVFDNGEMTYRLPFYFVPRTFPEIVELDNYLEFEVNSDFGAVLLGSSGPLASNLWAYPVSLISDNDPDVLDAGDLRYVGMDWAGYSSAYGDIVDATFAMWGGVHTNQPYFSEVDLYIDTPTGSVLNFNYNYGAASGGDDNNDWIVAQMDSAYPGYLFLASPYSIFADYNSGVQEWYLPAVTQYITDEFDYAVASYDWNQTEDYAGAASFDITRPPLYLDYSTIYPDNEIFMVGAWVTDFTAYRSAGIQGFMLVDFNGKAGAGQSYYWELSPFMNINFPMFMH